jgi:hypothetical protein
LEALKNLAGKGAFLEGLETIRTLIWLLVGGAQGLAAQFAGDVKSCGEVVAEGAQAAGVICQGRGTVLKFGWREWVREVRGRASSLGCSSCIKHLQIAWV